MREKIERLLSRLKDIEASLGDPEVVSDRKKYRQLTQDHAYLEDIRSAWEELQSVEKQLEDNEGLLKGEQDPELQEMVQEDNRSLKERREELNAQIELLLVPPDPNDHRNTIMEIRAGTGGDEACLFVADCVRMYKCFADQQGWKYERLSCTESDRGGFREYVMVFSGKNVYRFLRFEGGTHRVQRVPETESQGRIHTSAITVAVLLEPDEEEDIVLNEQDLRVETYRASGAGGQHVNTTDSAVRITHLPTGAVAYCSEERSQHKNKEKVLRMLKAQIVEAERQKVKAAEDAARSSQVGSGDRSERIRTYNFPQNRVTDHRINYTRYNLDLAMNGDLDDLVSSLVADLHQKRLAEEV